MKKRHLQSRLISPDYRAPDGFGSLTTPIHHASTVTFPNVAAMRARNWLNEDSYTYGLQTTPTTYQLKHRVAELEGGRFALLAPSGLSAISVVNLGLLKQADEVMMPANIYAPNREMATQMLSEFGVGLVTYDPCDVAAAASKISDRTRLIWLEAPGSVTMEMPDIRALTALARQRGILTALDNTWSAGILMCGFDVGVDIVMQALTKYPSGGSDVLMGSIVTRDQELHRKLKLAHARLGLGVSGDDAYLVLRGLTSLSARLKIHEASALLIAHWFANRPEVDRVLHPALESDPGHAIWKRDFKGAGGLFSVVFKKDIEASRVDAMVDRLELFSIGYSWGGSHSLAVPYQMDKLRAGDVWKGGALVRFYIGLEEPADLIDDLNQAFTVFG